MTSLKTSIKTITYLSDTGCLEIQGASLLPDHVINFLGGRDGVNTLGNLTSSVKDIFAGSNRNIRHSPGVREDRLKNVTKDDNKDGIKG
ncbi:hypothetical protein SNB72_25105 (plasmid) [Escherichia coli]|nr:hypothetical protein SNB72_25105 [Escherichia coli]